MTEAEVMEIILTEEELKQMQEIDKLMAATEEITAGRYNSRRRYWLGVKAWLSIHGDY